MASETECLLKLGDNFWREEELKVEKDFLHKYTMTRLESLKKSSHFGTVLKNEYKSQRVKGWLMATRTTIVVGRIPQIFSWKKGKRYPDTRVM